MERLLLSRLVDTTKRHSERYDLKPDEWEKTVEEECLENNA